MVARGAHLGTGYVFSFANLTASLAHLAITADFPAPAVPMTRRAVVVVSEFT